MATKNFRSTVLEPTSEFAHGDKLRFTALATVGEVLKGSFSETTIGEDGVYSVDLQYGKHRIDYKPYEGCWRHFADVEVNADTLATTLQDLALASVPVTDETILVLQGILADAEAAKTESAAIRDEAAASAAAAAEDAAKLADVTPESIGAVSNVNGNVAFKPAGSGAVAGATDNKYLIFEIPQKTSTIIGARIRIASRTSYISNEILLSFYNYDKAGVGLDIGFAVTQSSSSEYTVQLHRDADNKSFIVIYTSVNFQADTTSQIIDVMTGLIGSSAASWKDGWSAYFAAEIDPTLTMIQSSTMGAVSRDLVLIGDTYYTSSSEAASRGISATDFDAALKEQQDRDLFESEKSIALKIMADFNLGTGEHEITGSDIADVRAYVQSIDPAKGLKAGHLQRAKIPRPSIFDRYS